MMLFFWPLGLVFIIGALVMDKTFWICGRCGNKVEKTGNLCPCCHSHLS